MKFAIINGHLPNFEPLARLTTYANRAEYCSRHGYDLHVKTSGWEMPARHPVSWDRLRFMRDILASGKYDWVYCCGTDTLHTNMTVALDAFTQGGHHVAASPDWCVPIQADSFLVRNTPEGLGWLDAILKLYPKYKDHVWVENAAMVDTFDEWKHIIRIFPQRSLNAYSYPFFRKMYPGQEKVRRGLDYFGNDGQWRRGDFLIHWPSLPLQKRIDLASIYSRLIVR